MPRLLTTILLILTSISAMQIQSSPPAQSGCRAFPDTGKTVCGRFLQYWQTNGGLAQQGYPISGQFQERSGDDGKTYTVQYFERAVFEMHPENKAPYDVLLSMLGRAELAGNYPNGLPDATQPLSGTGMFFPETGQSVSGPFLAYWQANGGLAQQGYPISGTMTETFTPNSKPLLVQYFERARFELHPEIGATPTVLLSRLGAERYESRYAYGEPVAGDVWSTLRARPLNLPYLLSSGAACTADKAGTVNPDFGLALGSGPVYPIGFDANGKYNFSGTSQDGAWYNLKVLWTADPARYSGPILVRGHQVDGPNDMRFGMGSNPAVELQLDPKNSTSHATGDHWPDWPTYTRLRAPGCYAYQIDGTNFTKVLTFRADNK